MSFLTWLFIGLCIAALATLFLKRKGYPALGLLFILCTGIAVLSGWRATQLGWEWGDAITFNYRSALAALAGVVVAAPIITFVLNILYPAQREEHSFAE